MEWQRYVADVALELDDDGTFAYREIVVTVPRQSGKTHLMLSLELRCVLFSDRVDIAYSAQDGTAAKKKLLLEQVPRDIRPSDVWAFVEKVYKTPEYPGVWFKNGSSIVPVTGSEEAGHGMTLEMAVIDEAFADVDDRREQSLLAAMATRRNAQLLVCSTAGTEASVYLNRKNEAGRQAVLADSGHGLAYFEWSASPEELERGDWAAYHPAVGQTIDASVIEHAKASMAPAGFARAWGNVPDSSADDRPLPPALWERVRDVSAAPERPVFGAEVSIDRSSAAVVAVDASGACELVEQRGGVEWLPARLAELCEAWGGRVALDGRGPAAPLVEPLRAAGVTVEELSTQDMARATSGLVDAIADGQVRVRPAKGLDDAVQGAARRWSGDQWFWGRRSSLVDVSPLVALTAAWWTACRVESAEAGEVNVRWI
jgi:hypothetical protein